MLFVRGVMAVKGLLTRFVLVLRHALLLAGRVVLLPVLVRGYRLALRLRRALLPAERQFMLAVTHRGLLHAAVIGIALTTAGGNLYAQGRNTVSNGEGSILYQFLSGEDEVIEESGPPRLLEERYAFDSLDVAPEGPVDYFSEADLAEQGSDTLTELGALMPETVAGSEVVHRTVTEEYVVAAGDTLSGIANRFGVSIATILWQNKLSVRSYLQPGQKLVILPTTGVSHTVKSGDTLKKVAAAYKADVAEIIAWNNIVDEGAIQAGQVLIVPGGSIAPPPAPPPPVKKLASPIDVFVKPPAAVDHGSTTLLWPVTSHIITQYYGNWRPRVGRHTGIDIGDKSGNPIYASDDGIVTHAGCGTSCRQGYGYYVDIDHGNGLATRYGHMSKIIATRGAQVRRGEVIGLIGSTGLSTGPHLHFEVRVNGSFVNPLPHIK